MLEGIAELWHTDLDLSAGPPTLLIRWSPDLLPPDSQVLSLPNHAQRGALAQKGQATIRRLTLSSLGAWADLQLGQDIQATGASPAPGEVPFWHQITGAGRNELVKLEGHTGSLRPFGFRALLITVTERKPVPASDGTATETLITTTSLMPITTQVDFTDPSLGLPNGGKGLPFTRIRLITGTIPALNPPPHTDPRGEPDQQYVPVVSNNPVQFHMVATDWAGADVDLVQPLLWVPDGVTADYAGANIPPAQLTGAPVTYLRVPASAPGSAPAPSAAAPGSVALPTSQMSFVLVTEPGGQPVPTMAGATVSVPAVGQALGSAGATAAATIAYYANYLTGAGNAASVFARFVPGLGGLTDPASDPTPTAALALGMPADRAGGLASANLSLSGLSQSLGPVAGSLDDLAGGVFNPATIFTGLGAKLFGAINLVSVIAEFTGLDPAKLPVLAHQQGGDQIVTTFDWSPPLASTAGGPIAGILSLSPGTRLELHAKTVTPLNAPGSSTYTLSGTLSDFTLTFLGTVEVGFDQLRFFAQSGQKVDLGAGNVQITFENKLAFVNVLASLLPVAGFSDPPFLTSTDDGVTAGYTLEVPTAAVGVLSLENLSMTAALDLPFDGAAAIRLAFAERSSPFLCTVSLIAGGAYLAVEVDATGIRRVEGSLELGANLTIDFVIVSANVHVIAGFFFSYDEVDGVQFDAYLRIGGSVNLLGIVSLSIELVLTLGYDNQGKNPTKITGSASVTVLVSVLMMSQSFTLSASRDFPLPGASSSGSGPGPAGPVGPAAPAVTATAPGRAGFGDLMTQADFATYCKAFS